MCQLYFNKAGDNKNKIKQTETTRSHPPAPNSTEETANKSPETFPASPGTASGSFSTVPPGSWASHA